MTELQENKQIVVHDVNDASKEFTLSEGMVTIEAVEKTVMEEKFLPNVIEPSFGIGRIIYCIFEHCFHIRPEEATRTFFHFKPAIAPLKTSILPLVPNSKELNVVVRKLKKILNQEGLPSKVDDSSQTIGRRYARTDECGIPFAITVDFESISDDSVTLRELLTMKQIRIKIDELADVMKRLSKSLTTWEEVLEKYPSFESKGDEGEDK